MNASHAAEYTMDHAGISHCDQASEAYAYTLDRYFQWAIDCLKTKGSKPFYPNYL